VCHTRSISSVGTKPILGDELSKSRNLESICLVHFSLRGESALLTRDTALMHDAMITHPRIVESSLVLSSQDQISAE
jgi:hypothetical protein